MKPATTPDSNAPSRLIYSELPVVEIKPLMSELNSGTGWKIYILPCLVLNFDYQWRTKKVKVEKHAEQTELVMILPDCCWVIWVSDDVAQKKSHANIRISPPNTTRCG